MHEETAISLEESDVRVTHQPLETISRPACGGTGGTGEFQPPIWPIAWIEGSAFAPLL